MGLFQDIRKYEMAEIPILTSPCTNDSVYILLTARSVLV